MVTSYPPIAGSPFAFPKYLRERLLGRTACDPQIRDEIHCYEGRKGSRIREPDLVHSVWKGVMVLI